MLHHYTFKSTDLEKTNLVYSGHSIKPTSICQKFCGFSWADGAQSML